MKGGEAVSKRERKGREGERNKREIIKEGIDEKGKEKGRKEGRKAKKGRNYKKKNKAN